VKNLNEDALHSKEKLAEFIHRNRSSAYHPVGTARMGPESDRLTVVDQYCRVLGIQGLRVVDGSIMPNNVRANTNLTCIMIGERVADWMKVQEV
jgi:choline dehydrogenase